MGLSPAVLHYWEFSEKRSQLSALEGLLMRLYKGKFTRISSPLPGLQSGQHPLRIMLGEVCGPQAHHLVLLRGRSPLTSLMQSICSVLHPGFCSQGPPSYILGSSLLLHALGLHFPRPLTPWSYSWSHCVSQENPRVLTHTTSPRALLCITSGHLRSSCPDSPSWEC